jgi:hypothetical protein
MELMMIDLAMGPCIVILFERELFSGLPVRDSDANERIDEFTKKEKTSVQSQTFKDEIIINSIMRTNK